MNTLLFAVSYNFIAPGRAAPLTCVAYLIGAKIELRFFDLAGRAVKFDEIVQISVSPAQYKDRPTDLLDGLIATIADLLTKRRYHVARRGETVIHPSAVAEGERTAWPPSTKELRAALTNQLGALTRHIG